MSIVHRSFSCIKKIEREGEEGGVRFKKGYGFSGEACIPGTSHITNLECGSELLRTCCCTPLDAKLYLKQHQKLGNGRGSVEEGEGEHQGEQSVEKGIERER